jgi:hypothetical protein
LEFRLAQLDDLAIFGHAAGYQAGTAAEHVNVATKSPRALHCDRFRRAARMPDNLDRALEHREEGTVENAFFEQDLSGVHLTGMTPRGERREILGTQGGKRYLIFTGHAGVLPASIC